MRREYRSTYRDSIVGSERLLEGELWDASTADAAQVSLERDIAADLAVEIGDSIVWDVQGVRIPTVVTSIREVDWARFEPNFFAVFPTAALVDAPKTWVALTRADSAAARGEIQRRAVTRWPNVSAVDLTQVQAALDDVIGRISALARWVFETPFEVALRPLALLGALVALLAVAIGVWASREVFRRTPLESIREE